MCFLYCLPYSCLGFIGFTNSTAVGSTAPAANVLFASQYAPIAGASAEPFIATEEGGEVYGFSGGKFTYAAKKPWYMWKRSASNSAKGSVPARSTEVVRALKLDAVQRSASKSAKGSVPAGSVEVVRAVL